MRAADNALVVVGGNVASAADDVPSAEDCECGAASDGGEWRSMDVLESWALGGEVVAPLVVRGEEALALLLLLLMFDCEGIVGRGVTLSKMLLLSSMENMPPGSVFTDRSEMASLHRADSCLLPSTSIITACAEYTDVGRDGNASEVRTLLDGGIGGSDDADDNGDGPVDVVLSDNSPGLAPSLPARTF